MSETKINLEQIEGLIDPANPPVNPADDAGKLVVLDEDGKIENDLLRDYLISTSDILKTSADTERYGTTTSYVKVKEIVFNENSISTMNIRVKFDLATRDTFGQVAYGQVYINGAAVGSEQSVINSPYYVSKTQDFTVVKGDLIQLYTKTSNGNVDTGYNSKIRNFRIYYDKTLLVKTNTIITD